MAEPSDAEVIARSIDDPQSFAAIFDRHAGLLFRFLIRRVGRDAADELLGETFRVAFERRDSFDTSYATARPWMYGIASNLVARHRRSEGRRLAAIAQLAVAPQPVALADAVAADVDARRLFPRVIDAVAALPDGERDALLLYAWEELSYEEVAAALAIPVGTVRSRLNRARTKIRELEASVGEEALPNDPWTLAEERDRLMSTIENTDLEKRKAWEAPAIYPRLAYEDERAAIDFLTKAFGFKERREGRMGGETPDDHLLAWLEYGDGVVMIGHSEHDIHKIYSPTEVGHITAMMNVTVDNIDAHYERAQAAGATITMEINDAFWGDRRYEALDSEGHKWHFSEPLEKVKARRG